MRENFADVLKGLQDRGWKEGANLEVIYASTGGVTKEDPKPWTRLPQVARTLAARSPDVILTAGPMATRAAADATRTIPIVTVTPDPVGSGFAASLVRPGGNVTGISRALAELSAKSIEILRAVRPNLSRLAVLHLSEPSFAETAGFVLKSARNAGIEAVSVPIDGPASRILAALADLRSRGVQAAYHSSGIWKQQSEALATAAIRARLAVWSEEEAMVESGILGSLAAAENEEEVMAAMLDRVLRGANPAELPIQYPQRFRLAINNRTAVALGLKIPPDVLLRADRVIE